MSVDFHTVCFVCTVRRSANLDDLILRPEAGFLCGGVVIHGPDELARPGLLAVQVEAVATLALLHVAEAGPQSVRLILHTHSESINQTWQL